MNRTDEVTRMMPARIVPNAPARVRGIALIVGLIILAVLSLIGVAAFTVSTQEERMAGNSRDRIRAFEAAEAALRDCEDFIAANGTAAFAGPAGMYPAPGSSASPSVTENQPETFWQDAAKVRRLPGAYAASNSNAFPPACVAEKFTLPNASWQLGTPYTSTNSVTVAHVTAHGYGANRNTVVALESYYAM
jgi:type IV pilus assembly protein PilX